MKLMSTLEYDEGVYELMMICCKKLDHDKHEAMYNFLESFIDRPWNGQRVVTIACYAQFVNFASVVKCNIKDFDIVSRLTGDEFLLAIVNPSSIGNVEKTAQKIINDFAKVEVVVNPETGQILQKTICIGISLFPYDSNDINQVLKNADNFLNEAKNKGRSQYAFYKKEEESSIDLF